MLRNQLSPVNDASIISKYNPTLVIDMLMALDTIMRYGNKYLKFVVYSYGMDYVSWFISSEKNNCKCKLLVESLQTRLMDMKSIKLRDAHLRLYQPVCSFFLFF